VRRSAVVAVGAVLLAGVLVALWVVDSRSSSSSNPSSATRLIGVRITELDSVRAQAVWLGVDDDLVQTRPPGELDGPHYTLALLSSAIGTKLSATDAHALNTTPVRAPRGQQLVVALIDPESTYAAFGPADVSVTVTVAGQATPITPLPLPHEPGSTVPRDTVAILLSAPPSAPLHLRATDAGRAEELDLRTGNVLVNSFDLRQSDDLNWSGSTVVAADQLGLGIPSPTKLTVQNADTRSGRQVATLTNYAPGVGWAPRGSAILLVPAPRLFADGDYIGAYEEFDDRTVFTFRSAGGKTTRAQSYPRDVAVVDLEGDADDAPVGFVVPAGNITGTVTMDLAKAQLRRAPSLGRKLISWTKPPAPFALHVSVTS